MFARRSAGMWLAVIRYGLPATLFVVGLVILFAVDDSTRWDGWAMCWGSAGAILLLNVLFRYGAKGDEDRAREEEARRYFGEHGRWPDEDR